MEIKDFEVSSGIYDSWKVKTPCELSDPYCHVSCPYYSDCFLYADL